MRELWQEIRVPFASSCVLTAAFVAATLALGWLMETFLPTWAFIPIIAVYIPASVLLLLFATFKAMERWG